MSKTPPAMAVAVLMMVPVIALTPVSLLSPSERGGGARPYSPAPKTILGSEGVIYPGPTETSGRFQTVEAPPQAAIHMSIWSQAERQAGADWGPELQWRPCLSQLKSVRPFVTKQPQMGNAPWRSTSAALECGRRR